MSVEENLKYKFLYDRERKKINNKIEKIFKSRQPFSLYQPASYILEGGGKRLRPLLVLLSAKAVGGNLNKVYNAAVAVELLHNFTLVHDDIMDNADKRRGRFTLHKKYDINTAILVGDAMLAVAYEYLLKDAKEDKKVLAAFTKGLIEVCEGQGLDKEFETNHDISLNDYLKMIQKKTAAMVEMCCSIGAQLGGGSDKEVKALSDFGRKIGLAFQIQDDLLDIYGEEKEFGKITGGDLMEGKKTYLLLKALEKAKGKDKEEFMKILKNKGTSKDKINFYKELYLKLGIFEDAKKEIINYSKKAVNSLKIISKNEDRRIFTWLSDSLVKRSN